MAVNVERDQKLRMWAIEAIMASHAAASTAVEASLAIDQADILVNFVLGKQE
jgi:hypothetical protein